MIQVSVVHVRDCCNRAIVCMQLFYRCRPRHCSSSVRLCFRSLIIMYKHNIQFDRNRLLSTKLCSNQVHKKKKKNHRVSNRYYQYSIVYYLFGRVFLKRNRIRNKIKWQKRLSFKQKESFFEIRWFISKSIPSTGVRVSITVFGGRGFCSEYVSRRFCSTRCRVWPFWENSSVRHRPRFLQSLRS